MARLPLWRSRWRYVLRRIGLEQEFFLVDEAGSLSDRADEFLKSCQFIAQAQVSSIDIENPLAALDTDEGLLLQQH